MSDDQGWRREERHEALTKKDKDLPLYSLAGWSTGVFPQEGIFLGIEFLIPPPVMSTQILRLVMTRTQCAELATALQLAAQDPSV
jgi:hypothetical protein